MATKEEMIDTILGELKSLAENAFPKVCPSCGARFENLEEFLAETEGIPGSSGLFEEVQFSDRSLKDILRNCTCGSTLLAVFKERRDTSPAGEKMREKFQQLLLLLENSGIEPKDARAELLAILHGGSSQVLEEKLQKRNIEDIQAAFSQVQKKD